MRRKVTFFPLMFPSSLILKALFLNNTCISISCHVMSCFLPMFSYEHSQAHKRTKPKLNGIIQAYNHKTMVSVFKTYGQTLHRREQEQPPCIAKQKQNKKNFLKLKYLRSNNSEKNKRCQSYLIF